MSGRIKPSKNERLYYCPDRERSWVGEPSNSDDKWVRGKGCDMNRSLNIPRTDALVWNSVKSVVSKSGLLQKRAEEGSQSESPSKEALKAEKLKQKQDVDRLRKIEGNRLA